MPQAATGERAGKGEKEERERRAGFKEPTVVKEPSSSLHLDTHKYKAQPFELPRRVSSFHLSSSLSLSYRPLSLCLPAPSFSRHLGAHRSLPCWQSKFISRSCLFWTFHNIWPCFGIQQRSRRAPLTRRYGFEPSVMDGSLSSPPRIAASTLCPSSSPLLPSFSFHLVHLSRSHPSPFYQLLFSP